MTFGTIDCHGCGKPTPSNLIDAKPFAGATLEQIEAAFDRNDDFNRLECRDCYGPGWNSLTEGTTND